MSIAPDAVGVSVPRRNTREGVDPFSTVEWETREARIADHKTGGDAFYEPAVEFPVSWSQNATNIVAQKYFRVVNGERETSLRQTINRIAGTIAQWGYDEGYFATDADFDAFLDELRWLMVTQKFAFNSPVWFNIGVNDVPQQCSACFILAVEDDMRAILNWYVEEGIIFKGGSGAGVNLSSLRASSERLSGGGFSSGPVTFMRGADASAGTIKSGGTTRRAAKMVLLDGDHPDVEMFIWCKAKAERKARALEDAGFDMDLDGSDTSDIPYQNANNSVRLTDEFMQACVSDGDWNLINRKDGSVARTVKAKDILRQIAESAWECADPGVQFSTTINRWHTSPARGPINGSNPCSEFVSNDNSSCNLASLRLTQFLNGGAFDVEAFKHAVRLVFIAQDILISRADFPTDKITEVTRSHRQIGLGYMDLGAMLMQLGLPYDSDEGRNVAAAVTSLMSGVSYSTSGDLAEVLGPYSAWEEPPNREATCHVLTMHRDEAVSFAQRVDGDPFLDPINRQACAAWRDACTKAEFKGVRNSQATLLAPTGTISFAVDSDTTGIEPDLGLVKTKKLVGGGSMRIVNQAVPSALHNLGYGSDETKIIVDHISDTGSALGAPGLKPEHLPVFACSMSEPTIDWSGHVKMMAAVQPFLSGAISKTVNLTESASVEDIERVFVDAWRTGVKCVAVYRDGSKVGQPLSIGDGKKAAPAVPPRSKLTRRRHSETTSFRVADAKGYMIVGEYEDGSPGELFLMVAKAGSTLGGVLSSFAIQFSHSLQYHAPLKALVAAHVNTRFEPAGLTNDPEVRQATSIIDYVVRRMAVDYLSFEDRMELGVLTAQESSGTTVAGKDYGDASGAPPVPLTAAQAVLAGKENHKQITDRLCSSCGGRLVRAGACYACEDCGTSTGCG